MALGVSHAGWGVIAYRRQLRDLVHAGTNSVGDGIFRTDHAKDDRAAAFWFIAAAPLVIQSGYLVERALRAGDGETVAHVGWVWAAFGAAGVAVMPSGGFVWLLPIGAWMAYRGSRIDRSPNALRHNHPHQAS
jgi:hypothetical protein